MQDAHIVLFLSFLVCETTGYGVEPDSVEASISQKKRCVLETRPYVRQNQRHYYGDVTSISEYFYCVFQWELLKNSASSSNLFDSRPCMPFCQLQLQLLFIE